MKYWIYFTPILLLFTSLLHAQPGSGYPFIDSYSPKLYNAHPPNWAIVQDKRGVMYFGNTKGVLEYDGVTWRLISVNQAMVRSLAVDNAGTIYVGASGDFGYLGPDHTGKLQFKSLLPKVNKSDKVFTNVWSIVVIKDEVYFHTSFKLFRYKNGTIKTWDIKDSYIRCFGVHNKLYVRQSSIGLCVLQNEKIIPVTDGSIFSDEPIGAMLPLGDQILIGSRNNGLFHLNPVNGTIKKFASPLNDSLSKEQIQHATVLADGNFAFGTSQDGLRVMDIKGNQVIHVSNKNGLASRAILFTYVDRHGLLWLATGNGIAKLDAPSPITFKENAFELDEEVNNIINYKSSQCYRFIQFYNPSDSADHFLLATTPVGVLQIKDGKSKLIYKGVCRAITVSLSNPYRVFVSGYGSSIASILYEDRKWKTEGTYSQGNNDFWTITEDHEKNLWLGTLYTGVFKLKIEDWNEYVLDSSQDLKSHFDWYGIRSGLPSESFNNVFTINNKMLLGTQKGIYEYNKASNNFKPNESFQKLFKSERRFYCLKEDSHGNIWFTSDHGKGVIVTEGNQFIVNEKPFHRILTNDYATVYPSDSITTFTTIDGTFSYNIKHDKKNYDAPYNSLIRNVTIANDSVIFSGTYYQNKDDNSTNTNASLIQPTALKQKLSFQFNSLRFGFAATSYEKESTNKFSYFLEGYDRAWSEWAPESKKEYTNLHEGKYIFRVKAKNLYQTIGSEASYEFTILPPWYRTPLAYVAYVLLFTALVFTSTKIYARQLEKDNLRLEANVQIRTLQINNQKLEIERQKNALTDSYHELTATNEKLVELNEELTTTLEDLRKAQSQLIHAEKMASLGQLTAGVAHEINNPINFISGGISSLEANFNDLYELVQRYQSLKPNADNREQLLELERLKQEVNIDALLSEIPELLKSINTGTHRTVEIVKALKNFSRVDDEGLKPANINEGIDSTLIILKNQFSDRINVVKCYGNIPEILCHPGQLNQVFMNILSNSIHAIEGQGEISITTYKSDEHVIIEISDTGKGMAPEIQNRIFEPFFTTKDVGEGTGLGLSISYSIIEKHKGKILVDSAVGQGSTFTIYLPINPA